MSTISTLLSIMAQLRDPKKGCPWDVEQTHATLTPYAIEEAYEVADAVAEGDMGALKEELGDLLLQTIFHAQIAKENKQFDFEDVVKALCVKLVARHPHVFGDVEVKTAQDQENAWERIKSEERAKKTPTENSLLDGITKGLPGLLRAVKLTKRAAKVGFDWTDPADIFAKLDEEILELKDALTLGSGKAHLQEELGDILFVCANLARRLDIDPEEALRTGTRKFDRRFRSMEAQAKAQKLSLKEQSLEQLETLWQQAKQEEKAEA